MTKFNDRLKVHLDSYFEHHRCLTKENYEWLKSVVQDVNK